MKEKKLLLPPLISRRFCICARSQLRDITAWALSSSIDEVAFISLDMTLTR